MAFRKNLRNICAVLTHRISRLTKTKKNPRVYTTSEKYIADIVAPPPVPPALDDLFAKIEQWGHDRLIIENSTPQAQLLKCVSELGELADATLKNDTAAVMDGVGDVIVTLIMFSAVSGIQPVRCLELAYNTIKDRKGHLTPEGVFVKDDT
jgi:NTP pyrophosphatase (non-canonical NTP hydrolase)